MIAVVDDDLAVCSGLQWLLLSSGLTATTFTSGREFLAWLETTTPDCILLDLSMPELDGLSVQQEVIAAGVSAPIIIISATESDQKRQAMAAGAFAYVAKPFDAQLLLDTIRGAIRSARNDT